MSKREAKEKVIHILEFCAEAIGLLLMLIPLFTKHNKTKKKGK